MTLLPLSWWYMKRSFINSFKRHKVMFLVIFLFFAGLVGITNWVAHTQAEKTNQQISAEEREKQWDKIPEYAEKDHLYNTKEGYFLGGEDGVAHEMKPIIIEGVAFMLVILVVGISFANGAKSGANFFSMADVNFLFPSPHKPQAVLGFKMIAQVGMTLMGSLFLLYQYPNLVSDGLFSPLAFVLCFVVYVALGIMNNFVSLTAYLLFYNHPNLRQWVSKICLLVGALPILIFLFLGFVLKIGLYKSFALVCTSIGSRCIPYIGWMKSCFSMLIQGEYLWALFFFAITVLFAAILLKWIFSRNVDFYEDSLDFAMVQQQTLERMQDRQKGMTNATFGNQEKIEKKSNRIRNKTISFDRYPGASAFFKKNIANRMRQSRLKGLFAGSLIFNLFIAGLLYYMYRKPLASVPPTERARYDLVFSLIIVLVFALVLFFRSRTNPLQLDMNVNFIYMIPQPMSAILLWSYAAYMIEGIVDMLPIAVVLYLVSGNIPLTLLLYAMMLCYYLYISLCGVALNSLFRVYIAKLLMQILSFILAGAPLALVYLLRDQLADEDIYMAAGFTSWLLLALSVVFFFVCTKLLRRGKE